MRKISLGNRAPYMHITCGKEPSCGLEAVKN